jgi:hypothetical protein
MALITENNFKIDTSQTHWSIISKENVVMSAGFLSEADAITFRDTGYCGYYDDCTISKTFKPYGDIIKLANEICIVGNAMDYPEYDPTEPITDLKEALSILVMEHSNDDAISSEIFDFISNNVED